VLVSLVIISILEIKYIGMFEGYLMFVLKGALVLFINTFIVIAINVLLNRKKTIDVIQRIVEFVKNLNN
jgi:hypothetical protein